MARKTLEQTVDGLLLEARCMPNATRAADLLLRRARLILETPVSRYPEGVSYFDVATQTERLFLGAAQIREAAGLMARAA